jgi:hypothetical protein
MGHAGHIRSSTALARRARPRRSIVLVLALVVTLLHGLGVGRATMGACCPTPGAHETARTVADPICRTNDPRGGDTPRGHAEHTPCCLACPAGSCDGSAVATASPSSALASPMRAPSSLGASAGAGALVHLPPGWTSSWSSRAPPILLS